MERTHLARHDLDWLPPSMKAVRWTVAGTIWTALGGATAATLAFAKVHPYVYGKGLWALIAGGYYAGDRAARAVLRRRLHKLARGAIDLARLAREQDGELVHVRGTVRAKQQVEPLLGGDGGVYRRAVLVIAGTRLVHEAAIDFSLVDATGEPVTVLADGARLLADEPKRRALVSDEVRRVAALPLPAAPAARVQQWLEREARGKRTGGVEGGEVLLRDGDAVQVVGYKTRVVDPTVASRLERDTPMRATLRSGAELPLLIAPA